MKISLKLKDDQYPFTGEKERRIIARGIVFDSSKRIAIHHIVRDDMFCKQSYYETPGGGVEGQETLVQALKRELMEELGAKVEVLEELGTVVDAYNLIERTNETHYFLCRLLELGEPHFSSLGDSYIEKSLFVSPAEALSLYDSSPDELVSILVKRREMPFIRMAEKRLDSIFGK